jgi:predicted GIY-YIG superfamily endonuclease
VRTPLEVKRKQVHYVYALLDPRTNQPRYVGCTTDCARRLLDHINATRGTGAWLRELRSCGCLPTIAILEVCQCSDAGMEAERNWVAKYLEAGCDLLNVAKRPRDFGRMHNHKAIPIEFRGRAMSVSEWSAELGINRQTLRFRLERMSVEEAFTMPVHAGNSRAGHERARARYGHPEPTRS